MSHSMSALTATETVDHSDIVRGRQHIVARIRWEHPDAVVCGNSRGLLLLAMATYVNCDEPEVRTMIVKQGLNPRLLHNWNQRCKGGGFNGYNKFVNVIQACHTEPMTKIQTLLKLNTKVRLHCHHHGLRCMCIDLGQ